MEFLTLTKYCTMFESDDENAVGKSFCLYQYDIHMYKHMKEMNVEWRELLLAHDFLLIKERFFMLQN